MAIMSEKFLLYIYCLAGLPPLPFSRSPSIISPEATRSFSMLPHVAMLSPVILAISARVAIWELLRASSMRFVFDSLTRRVLFVSIGFSIIIFLSIMLYITIYHFELDLARTKIYKVIRKFIDIL